MTFLLTLIGWTIFRAASMTELILYLKAMFGVAGFPMYVYDLSYLLDARGLLALAAAVLLALPRPKALEGITQRSEKAYLLHTIGLVLLFAVSVVFMVNSTYNSFIYFQF